MGSISAIGAIAVHIKEAELRPGRCQWPARRDALALRFVDHSAPHHLQRPSTKARQTSRRPSSPPRIVGVEEESCFDDHLNAAVGAFHRARGHRSASPLGVIRHAGFTPLDGLSKADWHDQRHLVRPIHQIGQHLRELLEPTRKAVRL
jgi:hypothetical protein